MASPDVFFGDPIRPVGGNVVAHTSTYRIYFKKSGKKRIARMVDSPHHPEEEVIFALGAAGVVDPEEVDKKTKKTTKKATTKKVKTAKNRDYSRNIRGCGYSGTNSRSTRSRTVETPEIATIEEPRLQWNRQ